MRLMYFVAAAAAMLAVPAAAQVALPDGDVGGSPGSAAVTSANGRLTKAPVYIPVRPDGTVIDPAAGGTGASAQQVQGNVANAATDSGNPVKIGGVAAGPLPTFTAGQRVNLQQDLNGSVRVNLTGNGNGAVVGGPVSDGLAGQSGLYVLSQGQVFNGSTWDRQRGDITGTYVVEVPSSVTSAGVASVASAAVTTGQVIKASAGNLYGFNVVSGAAAGYVLVLNSATIPADGAVTPVRCLPIAANTGLDVNLRGQPAYFSAGVSIVFSTTGCFSKTASVTAFISGDAK